MSARNAVQLVAHTKWLPVCVPQADHTLKRVSEDTQYTSEGGPARATGHFSVPKSNCEYKLKFINF